MKAFIFDFDGVIVDSQKYWDAYTLQHFRSLLPQWTEEDNKRQKGMSVTDTHALLVREYGLTYGRDEFVATLDVSVRSLYDQSSVIDGIPDLLHRLQTMHIPIGLSTASHSHWMIPVLRKNNLLQYFQAISSADDVEQCKPHPDVYLRTARELNVDPMECIALEDSVQGMTSAKAAGMFCIGLKTPEHSDEHLHLADLLIAHPSELTMDVLRSL